MGTKILVEEASVYIYNEDSSLTCMCDDRSPSIDIYPNKNPLELSVEEFEELAKQMVALAERFRKWQNSPKGFGPGPRQEAEIEYRI